MTSGTVRHRPGWAGVWVALGILVGILVGVPLGFAYAEAPPAGQESHPNWGQTQRGASADTLSVPVDSIPALLLLERRRGEARTAILERGRAMHGAEATLWLELYSVVEEVAPEGGSRAVRALLESTGAGGVEAAASRLTEEAERVPEEDRPALLAFAALLLQPAHPEPAAELWERILEESPDSPRVMEAALYLARHRAGSGADRDGAGALLEEIIVAFPGHPLAPEARRLLGQIRGAGG